jgi:hypothetical protein
LATENVRDPEDYAARAIGLAADPLTPARLGELRRNMRARLRVSRACAVGAFARELERLYLDMLAASLASRQFPGRSSPFRLGWGSLLAGTSDGCTDGIR